jgi:hypothetical protein
MPSVRTAAMERYSMNIPKEILTLPPGTIIVKMTAAPVFEVFGFTHINHFALLIMEII